MTWPGIVAALAVAVGYWGWFAWDQHVRYGPTIVGNARWRRELPARQAAREARRSEREALSALTDEDRAWLAAMGWVDPLAPPTRAEICAWESTSEH